MIHKSKFLEMLQKRKSTINEISASIDIQDAKWSGDKLMLPVSFEELKKDKSVTATFSLDVEQMVLILDRIK